MSMTYAASEDRDEGQGRSRDRDHDERRKSLDEAFSALISQWEALAREQESRKQAIEVRWYADLRQYHGKYDDETWRNLKDSKRSKLFVKLTRAKANVYEARLGNMLFPTDDKNWGISPSAVPESIASAMGLQSAPGQQPATMTSPLALQAPAAAGEAPVNGSRAVAPSQPSTTGPSLGGPGAGAGAQPGGQEEQTERPAPQAPIKQASEMMAEEIEDQLKASKYAEKCRDMIHDGVVLGTGIIKGPMVRDRGRRIWTRTPKIDADTGDPMVDPKTGQPMMEYRLGYAPQAYPGWARVDPWNFFPDMNARTIDEAEFFFERHPMTRKEVRKFANEPGYYKDALREILREGPQGPVPEYIGHLREITGAATDTAGGYHERFIVWEYFGALEPEDYRMVCECLGEDEALDELEIDPLESYDIRVEFCQGRIIRFGAHHLDSGESLYDVFNLVKDDASLFGFGVPHEMRDSQASLNASWRAMMDNAGLAVGPQIALRKNKVAPADGVWEITGRKIWEVVDEDPNLRLEDVFAVFNIPMMTNEIIAMIELSKQFADDETNLPLISHGEQDANITKTFQGMALLQNSMNIVFRRVVKNFDDDVTVPAISRMYDFNMQFNEREEIKGDFEVDAKGSSQLLVREIQSQNLMTFAVNFSTHPIFGPMMRHFETFNELVRANMLPVKDLVVTKDEYAAYQEQQAQQGAEPSPDLIRAQAQVDVERIKQETALLVARADQETAMIKLAQESKATYDQLTTKHDESMRKIDAQIQQNREKMAHTERMAAADIASAERQAQQRAGAGVLSEA